MQEFVSPCHRKGIRMPIGLCRPRPWSIDWFAMPYSPSRNVHPLPEQNIRRPPHHWGWSLNRFTPMRMCIIVLCSENLMVLAFCFPILENLGALNDTKLEMYLL
jgi:hypothetical protein